MTNDKRQENTEDPREELDRLLKEQEDASESAAEEGRKSVKLNSRQAEQARVLRRSLRILPDSFDFESVNDSVDKTVRYLGKGLSLHAEANAVYSTSSDSGGTIVIKALEDEYLKHPSLHELGEARDEILLLYEPVEVLAESLARRFEALGIDENTGAKKPSELLDEAVAAYQNPVSATDPVASSLIPLRSCCEVIISVLLRRRPNQDKPRGKGAGKNWAQIYSTGIQLKRDILGEDQVREWAQQWNGIHDDLSSAKSAVYARSTWGRVLKRTLIFLRGFLDGLDPDKFRP